MSVKAAITLQARNTLRSPKGKTQLRIVGRFRPNQRRSALRNAGYAHAFIYALAAREIDGVVAERRGP